MLIKRKYHIDYIRMIALTMILFCHFFLIAGYEVPAFWFNTGVQIFLILSARLLNEIEFNNLRDVTLFYKKRLSRIIIPMQIYVLSVSLVLLFIKCPPTLNAFVTYMIGGAAFAQSGVLGLGHLWYLSVLLICYLLVPLLDYLKNYILYMKKVDFISTMLLQACLMVGITNLTGHPEYGVSIALFIFSYYWLVNDTKFEASKHLKTLLIPTIILVLSRIFLDSLDWQDISIYKLYDAIFVTSVRAFLALFIYSFCSFVFYNQNSNKFLLIGVSISYEIYLTHQFIQLGVYKFIPICRQDTLVSFVSFILISFILIIFNSYALKLLTNLIQFKTIQQK